MRSVPSAPFFTPTLTSLGGARSIGAAHSFTARSTFPCAGGGGLGASTGVAILGVSGGGVSFFSGQAVQRSASAASAEATDFMAGVVARDCARVQNVRAV